MSEETTVHRLLVTGDDGSLGRFNFQVAMRLNVIERRKQTILYTCMNEDLEMAKRAAENFKVTLQEIVEDGDKETYPVLVDNGPKWA